ncbi:MAG: ribosome assembly factor SBDS, partial [Nitrosopumilus sp.]|nr:ribosome assembly factor SBDS [Nitrosopumilus sp.]
MDKYQIIVSILDMPDTTVVRYSFEGEKFEILV